MHYSCCKICPGQDDSKCTIESFGVIGKESLLRGRIGWRLKAKPKLRLMKPKLKENTEAFPDSPQLANIADIYCIHYTVLLHFANEHQFSK